MQSLEKLSLSVILENFSIYTTAFLITEDDALRKNLLFLQRMYTQDIFQTLKEELKEEHLYFLLNEYLKEVEISSLLKCSTKENILGLLIPIAHNLHGLECIESSNVSGSIYQGRRYQFCLSRQKVNCHRVQKSQCKLECFSSNYDEDSKCLLEEVLRSSTNVEKISIRQIFNDRLLKLISSLCPNLISLDVAASSITSEGIRSLCVESNGSVAVKSPLKYMDLRDTKVEIEDVALLLKHLPCLEEVVYYELPSAIDHLCLLDKEDKVIRKLNVRKLDFDEYQVYQHPINFTRILRNCTVSCPKLRRLYLIVYKQEYLNLISPFSQLQTLFLYVFDPMIVIDLSDFLVLSGKKLNVLEVERFSLSVSTLVESCPHLERLQLSYIRYYQRLNEKSTKILNKLHSLALQNVLMNDLQCITSVMTLLNASPMLENLSLKYCNILNSDAEKELLKFSQKCSIKELVFFECEFQADFLKEFVLNCSSIEKLSLDFCTNITPDDIVIIEENFKTFHRDVIIEFM